jgi:Fic family protein
MGRLWNSLILQRHHPLFAQVPVESIIRDRQADYYAVLGQCDAAGNSTAFIEFALELTLEALKHVVMPRQPRMTSPMRIEAAHHHFAKSSFTRKDYLGRFPGLSPATASRDLQAAVSNRRLQREGEKATAKYRFV